MCFFPRNAILFFNKSGHLKEPVLIFFHCHNYEKSDAKIILGDDCSEKMEKLRQFIIAAGLKFGTDFSIDV